MTTTMAAPPTLDVEPIRARLAAATAGPWCWFGDTKSRNVTLATIDRGRQFVMSFTRWGMAGAAPMFQRDGFMRRVDEDGMAVYDVAPNATSADDPKVYRENFSSLRHPDAELIANAPTDVAALLAEVDRLRAVLAGACPCVIAESKRRESEPVKVAPVVADVATAGGVL